MGKLFFRQLFDSVSSTYTYLLGCASRKELVIIDPVLKTINRDTKLIKELGFRLKFGLNTHVHADHVTATGILKSENYFPTIVTILSGNVAALADKKVYHGDTIYFGDNASLEVRETPGHTNGCLTYVCHEYGMAFTGDALLIRSCGRTDFQNGDAAKLYRSIHSQILSLPDHYTIYPAHDYTGQTASSVYEERNFNPRINKSEVEFVQYMKNLQLDYPKQIETAVPANIVCGIRDLMDEKLQNKVFGDKE